ncbi:MAG: hypothetical protein ACON4Z_08050 [Planctomycetota bacterium]
MRTNARRMLSLAPLLLVAACASTPASDQQAKMGERRLLMPYLQTRSVGCSELVVEMTPNFYLHVSSPGVDPQRHRFDRVEKTAQVDKVWTNLAGGRAGWFTVTIGEPPDPTDVVAKPGPRTTFKVMNQFTLRVKERGEMALSCEATGPGLFVQEAGRPLREVRSFAVADGVARY